MVIMYVVISVYYYHRHDCIHCVYYLLGDPGKAIYPLMASRSGLGQPDIR